MGVFQPVHGRRCNCSSQRALERTGNRMDETSQPQEPSTDEKSRPLWLQLTVGLAMAVVLLALLGFLFRRLF